jgi:hypothetical protein
LVDSPIQDSVHAVRSLAPALPEISPVNELGVVDDGLGTLPTCICPVLAFDVAALMVGPDWIIRRRAIAGTVPWHPDIDDILIRSGLAETPEW